MGRAVAVAVALPVALSVAVVVVHFLPPESVAPYAATGAALVGAPVLMQPLTRHLPASAAV